MKDLIKDMLQFLKDNEEAKNRFNGCIPSITYYIDEETLREDKTFNICIGNCPDDEKIIFMLTALSSPNGNPICGFLEKEGFENLKVVAHTGLALIEKNIKEKKIINHAKTLRIIYLDALDEGKRYDEAYKLINKEYNKICQNKK